MNDDGDFYYDAGDFGEEPAASVSPTDNLPEGHWGRDPEWLQAVDEFVSQLYSGDERTREKLRALVEEGGGEEPPGYGTPGGMTARPFEKQAVELMKEINSTRVRRDWEK